MRLGGTVYRFQGARWTNFMGPLYQSLERPIPTRQEETKQSEEKPKPEIVAESLLMSWNELEDWQKDNSFIVRGYRKLSGSYAASLSSVFAVHNQTCNIHSHLWGLFIFALGAFDLWRKLPVQYSSFSTGDKIAFSCYFAGVFTCLSLSSAFHTLLNHSRAAWERFLLLDFLGILSLVAGSWIPGIYYGFFCMQAVSRFYWTMILSLSAGCAVVLCVPMFRTHAWRTFRITMFVLLGLCGLMPMTHAAIEYGMLEAHERGFGWYALEGIFYLSGALLYASKYPERLSPGTFDIVGSSHQLFHVLVLGGAWVHLNGIVKAFEYNHNPLTRQC